MTFGAGERLALTLALALMFVLAIFAMFAITQERNGSVYIGEPNDNRSYETQENILREYIPPSVNDSRVNREDQGSERKLP